MNKIVNKVVYVVLAIIIIMFFNQIISSRESLENCQEKNIELTKKVLHSKQYLKRIKVLMDRLEMYEKDRTYIEKAIIAATEEMREKGFDPEEYNVIAVKTQTGAKVKFSQTDLKGETKTIEILYP